MTSEAPELKPCPFCGGDAELMYPEELERYDGTVVCMKCHAASPDKDNWKDAIEAWNTRANLPTYDVVFAAGIDAAKKAIADLPRGRTDAVDEGHEQAFRAVEALTPSAPVRPKVKPLRWEDKEIKDLDDGIMIHLGPYSVRLWHGRLGARLNYLDLPIFVDAQANGLSRSIKAAAQADHEVRILSQIEMNTITVQEAANIVANAIDADATWANRMIDESTNITMETPLKHWFSQILRNLSEQDRSG